MKKIFFFMIILMMTMALSAQSSDTTLYVAVKTVEVKASSGFFAGQLGILTLGEQVTVQFSEGKWLVVSSASGLQGWVPADAFSSRRILPTGSGVSASEIAMAGKGFTEDLERIRRSSGEGDYAGVDAMERRKISPGELQSFLREGRLAEGD